MGEHQELVPSTSRVPNLTVGSDPPPLQKKKRNLPGNPDPDAEVIALSPKTLMATNRFVCEICGKGFQRDQNLQLHRRGHNLPWKLKQKSTTTTTSVVRKRVYICPEKSCVHHHPSRALGDLTGIKKHFSRKHGEKKWECEKCSKKYAVQSDWKAHSKICGTREYKCDCGAIFSRRDSFVTHRAFCNALAEETARVNAGSTSNHCSFNIHNIIDHNFMGSSLPSYALHPDSAPLKPPLSLNTHETINNPIKPILSLCPRQDIIPPCVPCSSDQNHGTPKPSDFYIPSVPSLFSFQQITRQTNDSHYMSATALLQKAAQVGATSSTTRQYSILANIGLESSNSYIKDHNNNDDYNGKFCGLYGSNLVPSSTLENEVADHAGNDVCSTLIINPTETYAPPVKRQKKQIEGDKDEKTRDFLGVGANPMCNASSINGWA